MGGAGSRELLTKSDLEVCPSFLRGWGDCGCRSSESSGKGPRGGQRRENRLAPKARGRREAMSRPRAWSWGPAAHEHLPGLPSKQRPLPVTYQWGLVIHVHHGVLQRRKPKQST